MSDKARIDALEKALQECVGYLRSLPMHSATYHQANAAQAVLDAEALQQPLYARETFDSFPGERLALDVTLTPCAGWVILAANGDMKAQLPSLELMLTVGLHVELKPDAERAKQYFEYVARKRAKYPRLLMFGPTIK